MTITITIILLCASAAAITAALYWYAFRYEPVNFKLFETKVYIRNKAGKIEKTNNQCRYINEIKERTSDQPFLKILHLSDFHLRKDRKGHKLFYFIGSLKNIKPDFIFLTGDLVEKDENFDFLIEMLAGLKASTGKYAVLGVHDYFNKTLVEFLKNMIKRKKRYRRENDVKKLISKLNSAGFQVLRNRAAFHKCNDIEIEISGLEDSIIRKADVEAAFLNNDNAFNLNRKDLKKDYLCQADFNCMGPIRMNSGQNNSEHDDLKFKHGRNRNKYRQIFKINSEGIHTLNNEGRLIICLTHTPDMDLLVDLTEKDVDIILCGHTHGGQVRLPLIGALTSGCNIRTRYCSGLFYFKKFVLYTSRGLGEGRYSPFRFFCQPEAALINIYKF